MDATPPHEFSQDVTFSLGEIEDFDAVLPRVDEAAMRIQEQQSRRIYERIGKVTDEAGTSVDAGGRSFNLDLYLDMLARVEIDFDDSGQAILPELHVPPDMMPRVREVLTAIENEPSSKKRFDDLMRRKKLEWRDRESDRKLVG